MKPYLILSSGAAKRLEWLRSRARHNGADWRAVRVAGFDGWRSYYGALTQGRKRTDNPCGQPSWAHSSEAKSSRVIASRRRATYGNAEVGLRMVRTKAIPRAA